MIVAPKVMLTTLVSDTVNTSSASSMASFTIVISIVLLVSPAANVSVPEVSVKSVPNPVAVPFVAP